MEIDRTSNSEHQILEVGNALLKLFSFTAHDAFSEAASAVA